MVTITMKDFEALYLDLLLQERIAELESRMKQFEGLKDEAGSATIEIHYRSTEIEVNSLKKLLPQLKV
jgi:hypothetical protein